MTPEQLKKVELGDLLVCTHGNNHFITGDMYFVQKDTAGYLVIECDEGILHYVDRLNPAHWTVQHEPKNLVTITKEEHRRLLNSEEKLSMLEAFGVDNWSGYSDAMKALKEGLPEEDF